MNNIFKEKSKIWCSRLKQLLKEHGYTQKTFLKEYKSRYGGGTQANVSRWLRVGNIVQQQNGDFKMIGFPSYENMLNIADFFGVTIGYLTGETDFETFEMEKACRCIGIEEETGKALRNMVTKKNIRFKECQKKAALKYLLTADSFPIFVDGLLDCAENIYYQKNSVSNVTCAEKKIKKELLDSAIQCLEYQQNCDEQCGEVDDFKAYNVEPTKELLEAISVLKEAIDKDYIENIDRENAVKISEYELQKVYFELIKDVLLEEHLVEMK